VAFVRKREMHIGFWYGTMKERDHFEILGIERRITL
jgi:hypothetical protein